MNKLSRQDAVEITRSIDRIANMIQKNHGILGIEPKIAKDFAYRCDLISDAIEITASKNFPKKAEYDAAQIGAEVPGPLESGEVDKDTEGHFTGKENSELMEVAEKLAKISESILKAAGHKTPATK
jgi:hypothetical protein